jgi:hypothetical protein
MAYQAKRKKLYTEDFELVEESGKVIHTLHVSLDPDSIAVRLSEKHAALVRALSDINQAKEESAGALEKIGNAVTDILEAVFGQEDAKTIIVFYQERYIEMCREVIPFVTDVVVPQVRNLARENKQSIISGYNRKQRRVFGKKG